MYHPRFLGRLKLRVQTYGRCILKCFLRLKGGSLYPAVLFQSKDNMLASGWPSRSNWKNCKLRLSTSWRPFLDTFFDASPTQSIVANKLFCYPLFLTRDIVASSFRPRLLAGSVLQSAGLGQGVYKRLGSFLTVAQYLSMSHRRARKVMTVPVRA